MAERPITAISETVEAPDREITRCAAPMRAAMSVKNGETSASTPISSSRALTCASSSGLACWVRRSRARSGSGNSAIADGMASEKNCAP
jgi:hypothetical protein